MIRSTHVPTDCARPFAARRRRAWPLKLLYLAFARPRLISNLLALVALFSIGFV